jgi:hypothetical protein
LLAGPADTPAPVPDAQVIQFPALSVPAAAGAPPDEQLGLF